MNSGKFLKKEDVKRLLNQLNEGSIKYIDLPEVFQMKKDKIRIPQKPIEPEQEECCGTGCRPCVFDIYEMKLDKYEEDIDELCNTLYNEQ